jgi:MOSC domain-containing protein YiiM
MSDDKINVGDIFQIGTALFQVTQPRMPCYKLAIKIDVEGFYGRILESGRLGFYFRVLEEGEVGAGDLIYKIQTDPIGMSISEVNKLMYFDKDNLTGASKALSVPTLSSGWKTVFESRPAKAKTAVDTGEPYRTLTVDRKVSESETIT